MRLAPVLAVAAVATAAPPRGFLLVATKRPVQLLQRDADADWRRDELGGLLRDICAQEKYPATVVVGDANEAETVERNRPCDLIQARLLPDRRRLNLREDGSIFPMRLFKVRAIAAFCNIYAEGTLYIDNDVQLRLPVVDELFAIFDTMRANGKTVGILKDPGVPPGHEVADIPEWFGERNGGVAFWGPGSVDVAEAWVAEMRFNTTKDGHDQMPLRKVLWRYRDVLYDLPATTQCRRCTRRTGRDPCAYLLWHNHRKKREEHKSPRTTACGYHAPPHELVLRHQHHGHASSSSPPEG